MTDLELIEKAKIAKKNSYSPYSNYSVGAALLTKSGKVFLGANIENAAYGPTNCSERSAVFSAISNGEKNFEAIAIVGGNEENFVYPCGVCRQVLHEFNPKIKIILGKTTNNKTELKTITLDKIFPNAFGPNDL